MKLTFLPLLTLLLLTGCHVLSPPYTRLATGEVVLSQQQIERLDKQNKIILDKRKNKVELTQAEIDLVEQHPEAAFSLAGHADEDEHVVSLVRQGSLHGNAKRITQENGWQMAVFDIPDQLVHQPFIVKGDDVPATVISLYENDEIYTCIDEELKAITFIPASSEQDTVIHN